VAPTAESGAFTVTAMPRPRRRLFFAKIDADEMLDKLKSKFPETWGALEKSEAASAMKKKFDELTNPSFQPDRRRLSAVEDFFRYTEEEGEFESVVNPNGRVTSNDESALGNNSKPTDPHPLAFFL
jgi:hypothetical protein